MGRRVGDTVGGGLVTSVVPKFPAVLGRGGEEGWGRRRDGKRMGKG